jgi:hypothetical protein
MPKNFSLAGLTPERDTFTDTDGTVYEMLNRDDFSVTTMAKARRIQKQFPEFWERLEEQPDDVAAAEGLEGALRDLVRMIIPDLPAERLRALTLLQKQSVLDFWNQRMSEDNVGEVKAGQALSRA